MSVPIDSRTLEKVRAFAERRRRLIVERGLCAFVLSLIVIMSALALLDRLVILPDSLRWTLSILGYGGVLLVLWRTCLRFLVHRADARELARMFEHADPSLREDLISAIELGEQKDGGGKRWDSEQFRALLQKSVARRIEGVEVKALLPQKLVAPWLRGAIGAGVLLGVLLLVPGLHFPKLLGRALLPGANLERPSDIIVTFLEPAPADRIVASGDTVDLLVSIEGGDADKVILETTEEGGDAQEFKLSRREGNRYSGAIAVNRHDVRYRVRAEGTITRFHTLESRPRPEVLEFAKTYHLPEYAGLPDMTASDDHGDLSALEGTRVDLELKVNQKIAKAGLVLKSTLRAIEDMVVPLEASGDGLLRGSVTLDGGFQVYRVELEAAESGFTNKFSPDYALRAVPDLVPVVQMSAPETNREVAVSARIPVTGSATDDVGLAAILQAWRIGPGEWQERALVEASGTSAEIAAEWDLHGLPLQPGETLFTRLVAVDTKGNRGESAIVRLAVTAEDTDTEKREWAARERNIAEESRELQQKLGEMAQAVGEAKKAAKENQEPALGVDGQQKIARAQAAVAEARHQADQVWEALEALRSETPGRPEEAEVRVAAEVVAEIRNQKLAPLEERISDWATKPKEAFAQADDVAEAKAWEAHHGAARVAAMERALAAEDQAEFLAKDVGRAAGRQRGVAQASAEAQSQPDSDEALAAVREQQEIAGAQTRELEQSLSELSEVAEGGEQNVARQMAADLKREREELEQAMAAEKPDRNQVRQQAEELKNRAEEGARQMDAMRQGLAHRADQAREEMLRQRPDPARELAGLEGKANELAWKREQSANEENPEQASRLAAEGAAVEEALAEGLESTADQLRDLAAFAQGASNPDRERAADLERAAQAADALADKVDEATSPELAKAMAGAARELKDAVVAVEAGARTAELAGTLRELAQGEGFPPEARKENAEAGEGALSEMRALPKALEQVEGANEAAQAAQQAANSPEANQLGQEMRERDQAELRNDENREPPSMQAQAVALEEQVRGISGQIEPQVTAAREKLDNMAPTIPEQLRALAQTAESQAVQAEALARTAGENAGSGTAPDPEIAAGTETLLAQSEETGERIDEIAGALAAEAGTEDLRDEASRERARDADGAIARLEAAAPEAAGATENLAEAATATEAAERAGSLKAAADQQRGLAESLGELADQMESIGGGGGDAEEARMALRGSEAETGVEKALDQAYGQAEELAALLEQAGTNPREALAALEQELPRNPPMRESLGEIGQRAAAGAAEALREAAAREGQLGAALEQAMGDQGQQPGDPGSMQAAAEQQGRIGEQVAQAGQDLSRAGRHESRLGNEALGEALSETGGQTEAVAEGAAAEAGQALAANQSQAAAAEKVGAAEGAVRQRAEEASALAGQPADGSGEGPAGATPGLAPSSPVAAAGSPPKGGGDPASAQASPPGSGASPEAASESASPSLDPNRDGMIGPFDPSNSEQAGFLAQALDSLDQAAASGTLPSGQATAPETAGSDSPASPPGPGQANPGASPPGGQGQSPGARSPGAPAESPAESALASATQSQARSMAHARAMGMTPGSTPSSPSGQAMAASASPGSSSESKGSLVMAAEAQRKLAPVVPGADGKAAAPQDWSRLPPKVAKDLLEGQRQDMSPEYRAAIENYYKAIAEKAGRKNQQ